MSIVCARIDNRFVHGQILEAWVPYLKVSLIIVASDAVAGNVIQKAAMEASVPANMGLMILRLKDAVSQILAGIYDKQRVMMLFESTTDVLAAVRMGLDISEINIGNIHFCSGKLQITPSVSVDSMDLRNIEELSGIGIRLFIRCVPTDPSKDVCDVIKRS